MTQKENCLYCNPGLPLTDATIEVGHLRTSILRLRNDRLYKGRCVVGLVDHKEELFELTSEELKQFIADVNDVARAVKEGFGADKINYGIFGDEVPHVHLHIVPKHEEGPDWGGSFVLIPPEREPMSDEEIDECLNILRSKLDIK